MGKNSYSKCKAVIEKIIQDGIEKQLTGQQMRKYLMKNIGTDDRTINRYIILMREFGFVKIFGNGVFEITNEVRR